MHDLDRQQLERYESESPLHAHALRRPTEVQEMELAAEFLEIASQAELEAFLGDLYDRAKAAAGDAFAVAKKAYSSDLVQQKVIPALKAAANAGFTSARDHGPAATGTFVGQFDPASAQFANDAAKQLVRVLPEKLFKEELEGLSGEDREFEVARRYIRFAIDALQRALKVSPRVPREVAAEVVIAEAARAHAPGLAPLAHELVNADQPDRGARGGGHGGRWFRQGGSIVIDLG